MKRKIVRILLFLLLLLLLVVGGFALGVYLQLIDVQEANQKYKLHAIPVVGTYFEKPEGAEDEVSAETEAMKAEIMAEPVEDVKPKTTEKKPAKKVLLSQGEIEKQMKEREAAEKKRVSKLARLYNQMKPKDAAEALDGLDDDICIAILQKMEEGQAAKVLSKFDAAKSARLTEIMYQGTRHNVITPADIQKEAAAKKAADEVAQEETAE